MLLQSLKTRKCLRRLLDKNIILENPVDNHLRPLKVNGEMTALEVSKEDVRVNNLYINGSVYDLPAIPGQIIGYTRIQNDGTGSSDNQILMDATLTVLQTETGTDLSVTFTAPPSGNVEIVMSVHVFASSKTIEFALSDASSFNEVDETHTYDQGVESSDETDRNLVDVTWAVQGLTSGTEYTYWIAGAETVSGTSNINHGRFRSTGDHYPPIIVKAIALPATIVTGG